MNIEFPHQKLYSAPFKVRLSNGPGSRIHFRFIILLPEHGDPQTLNPWPAEPINMAQTSKSDISSANYFTSKQGCHLRPFKSKTNVLNKSFFFPLRFISACSKRHADRAWRADFWHIYLSLNQKPLSRRPADRDVQACCPLRHVVQRAGEK